MKFSEKLTKLRKDNNLSQEALADKLDVSRQSVSKWESGQTYPEMDKLLTLCKIFNVTLDELTNDEVNITGVKKGKNTFNIITNELSYIMSKSVTMFKYVKGKKKVKLIFELIVIFIILLILRLPFDYLINLGNSLAYSYEKITPLISIWDFIINILYLGFFIFSYLYIYKTNYLDKYEIKENIQKEDIKERVTEVYYNNKENSIVLTTLGKILSYTLKFFLIIVCIPFIFTFIFLTIYLIFSIYLLFKGILYFGFPLIGIGSLIINLFIILLISLFIFNKRISFKKMFIMFISGLLLTGIGVSISILGIMNTKYVDNIPTSANIVTNTYEFDYKDNLIIGSYYNHFIEDYDIYNMKVNFSYDNTLKDEIKVIVKYDKDYSNFNINEYEKNSYNFIDFYTTNKFNTKVISDIINDLKDKTIYNYFLLGKIEVTILTSEDNLNKIKENSNNYYKTLEEIEENDRIDNLTNQINSLTNENYELKDELTIKDEEINTLKEKNKAFEEKINEYKENLKDLINE